MICPFLRKISSFWEHTIRDSQIVRVAREGENIREYGNGREKKIENSKDISKKEKKLESRRIEEEEKIGKADGTVLVSVSVCELTPSPLLLLTSFRLPSLGFELIFPFSYYLTSKIDFSGDIIQPTFRRLTTRPPKPRSPFSTNEAIPFLGVAHYAYRLLLDNLRSRLPRFAWRFV